MTNRKTPDIEVKALLIYSSYFPMIKAHRYHSLKTFSCIRLAHTREFRSLILGLLDRKRIKKLSTYVGLLRIFPLRVA